MLSSSTAVAKQDASSWLTCIDHIPALKTTTKDSYLLSLCQRHQYLAQHVPVLAKLFGLFTETMCTALDLFEEAQDETRHLCMGKFPKSVQETIQCASEDEFETFCATISHQFSVHELRIARNRVRAVGSTNTFTFGISKNWIDTYVTDNCPEFSLVYTLVEDIETHNFTEINKLARSLMLQQHRDHCSKHERTIEKFMVFNAARKIRATTHGTNET